MTRTLVNALVTTVALVVVGAAIYYALQGIMQGKSAASSVARGPTIAEADVFPKYMSNKRTINRLNRTAPIREGMNDRPAYGKRLGNFTDPRQNRAFTDAIANRLAKRLQAADKEYMWEMSEDQYNALDPNSPLSIR